MAGGQDELLLRQLVLETLLEANSRDEYINVVLKGVLDKYNYLDGKKKAFIKKLVTGCLERKIELEYIINCYSVTKTEKMKPVIRFIMLMGVYQILYMDSVYDTTACNLAVQLARKKGFQGLSGFVNGVLRTICRKKDTIPYPDQNTDYLHYASVQYSMPEWIVQLWMEQYGKETSEYMLKASLQDSKVTVRVDETLDEKTVGAMLSKWQAAGVKAEKHPYIAYAYVLSGGFGIQNMWGYQEGYFTVQDVSSMLVSECAGIRPGNTVIDVCAAPGGKTMHAAVKLQGSGVVHACDVSEYKTEKIRENIERMGLENVMVHVADATVNHPEFLQLADVVLADVPCSGLGVLGKKVDIKYRLSREQLQEIVRLQRKILANVCKYVKKGGTLVFSTCTVNQEENIETVRWMTKELPLEVIPLCGELPTALRGSVDTDGTLQLMQGVHSCDGFYIAKLRKL